MIKSFRHRGLRRLYDRAEASGVRADQLRRIQQVLIDLDTSKSPMEMNLPGYRLHQLKGDLKGYWSVTISGNWRVIFRFEREEACDVDLVDYH